MSETKLGKVSLTPKGAWDSTTAYEQLDLVSYDGGSWVAKKASTNVTPRANDCWMQVAEKGEKGNDATSSKSATYVVPRNTSNSLDPNMLSLCPWAAGNKFAFIPPENVVVEETTDGGETWTVKTVTDGKKRIVFGAEKSSSTSNIGIPLLDGTKSPLCGVRITISALNYKVPDGTTDETRMSYWTADNFSSYDRNVDVNGLFIWVNVAGAAGIKFSMEYATGNNPTTWKTTSASTTLRGWDGGNFVNVGSQHFGAYVGKTNDSTLFRMTFFTEKTDSNVGRQWISFISAYGANAWGEMSSKKKLAITNRLYGIDSNGNATFYDKLFVQGSLIEKNLRTIESISITEDVTEIYRSVSETDLFIVASVPTDGTGTLAMAFTMDTGVQYIQYWNYVYSKNIVFKATVKHGVLELLNQCSSAADSSALSTLGLTPSTVNTILSASQKASYIASIKLYNATIPAGSTFNLYGVEY